MRHALSSLTLAHCSARSHNSEGAHIRCMCHPVMCVVVNLKTLVHSMVFLYPVVQSGWHMTLERNDVLVAGWCDCCGTVVRVFWA